MRTLFIVNSIVAILFGLGFVLIPSTVVDYYGVELSDAGLYVAQLLGAAFIGFAFLTWFAKDSRESSARRAILLAMLVSDAIGFVVALLMQIADPAIVNSLGWLTVAIYLLLALGWGYFYFLQPSE